MNWDDWRFFLLLSRRGTLSAAARELAVTQPTVGRRISALERKVGAQLFQRSSAGFTLTASGARALAFAERMEQDAFGVERQLSGRDAGVRGTVRLTASEFMVTNVLSPLVGSLLARYPHLELELIADTRHLNLARREADLALRPRRFDQKAIVQRALGKLAFGLYAAPAYLNAYGAPAAGDGSGHVLVSMTGDTGDAARDWLATTLPRATRAVRTNGRDAMLALARSGVGLACLARVVGDGEPGLERVALSPAAPVPTLWLGMHRDSREIPRLRAVVTHLADHFRVLAPRLCPRD